MDIFKNIYKPFSRLFYGSFLWTYFWLFLFQGPILNEFGIFDHLFGHWRQIKTIRDLVIKYKRFISIHISLWWNFGHWGSIYLKIFTIFNCEPSGGQLWINLGYFITYFFNGNKLGTHSGLGCKCKRFISIHTSLWWIFWLWRSKF